MTRFIQRRLSYSNVAATIALFVALSGVAVAAGLPRNSVGPKQLKRNAVNTAKLRNGAVTSRKIRRRSVTAGKLAVNSVGQRNLGNGVITPAKLARGSVTNRAIANGAIRTGKLGNEIVTTAKLRNGSVTTGKLGNGSVTLAKLDGDVSPLVGPLRSGQTLRGAFYAGAADPAGSGSEIAAASISFQFPLINAPTVNIVDPSGATTPACPGLAGGNEQTPQAAAGQLCVYVTGKQNALSPVVPGTSLTRLGFGLETQSAGAAGPFNATGLWAVTAP